MSSRLATWIMASSWLIAEAAWAGPGEPTGNAAPGEVLDVEKAVQLALGRSRGLAAKEMAADALAKDAESVLDALRNPELRIRDLSSNYFFGNENHEVEIGVRWRPPALGELDVKEERERHEHTKRRVAAKLYRADLEVEVRLVFAQLAMLQQAVGYGQERLRVADELAAVLRRKVALGQGKLVDQIQAQRRAVKARGEAGRLRSRLEQAQARLGELTGSAVSRVTDLGDAPEEHLEFEPLRTRALQARPEVLVKQSLARMADARYGRERLAQIPWFSYVELAYHAESENRDWGELALGIDLPIFDWLGNEAQAEELERVTSVARQTALTESITAEVREALAEYHQADAQWRALRDGAVPFLEQSEMVLKEARARATVPADEVLAIELECLKTRRALLKARYRLERATIALKRVVGDLATEGHAGEEARGGRG